MSFLAPALLYGTALAAVPIVIHLLNKRRFRRLPWAAMEFLLHAAARSRKRLRVEDIIVMALRAGAVAAIALALARPVMEAGAASGSEVVILVDRSASMRLNVGAGTLFDFARARATEILSRVGVGGQAVVALFDSEVEFPAGVEPTDDIADLRAALDSASATYSGTDYTAALSAAQRVSRGFKSRAPAVFIISDFRDVELPASSLSSRVRGGVYLVGVADADGENLGVVAVEPAGAAFTTAATEAAVRIVNSHPRRVVAAVTLSVDGAPGETAPVPAPAGSEMRALIPAPAVATPGVHLVSASIPDDAYLSDNRSFAVIARRPVAVRRTVPGDAKIWIDAALDAAPAGSFDLSASGPPGAPLPLPADASADGFILAAAPSGAAADETWRRIREGAFAVVFLDAANAPAARDFLRRSGIDALARETLEPIDSGEKAFAPALEGESEITRFLKSSPDLSLATVRVTRVLDFAPEGEGITSPLSIATQDGKKAFLTLAQVGEGRAAIFNSPADRSAGSFVASPFFVPLLYEALGWLAGDASAGLSVPCGEPAALPLPAGVDVTEIDGPEGPVSATREATARGAFAAFTPRVPGFYSAAGRTVAANVPAAESVMRLAERGAIEGAFSGRIVSSTTALTTDSSGVRGVEVSRTLLLAAAAMLLAEMAFIYLMKRFA